MIRLYIADTSALDIASAMREASQSRRQKVLRLPNDEKKRQSLGAELLLKKAVGSTEYSLGKNGKPYFEDLPLCFSLAHSGSYAVCAVSDSDVGVDIEAVREGSERLASRFFAQDEYHAVAVSAQPDREFCRLWVLKESYIKATGSRLADMQSFSVADGIEGFCLQSFEYEGFFVGLCLRAESMDEIEIYKNVRL